jgi:hypothetical protein
MVGRALTFHSPSRMRPMPPRLILQDQQNHRRQQKRRHQKTEQTQNDQTDHERTRITLRLRPRRQTRHISDIPAKPHDERNTLPHAPIRCPRRHPKNDQRQNHNRESHTNLNNRLVAIFANHWLNADRLSFAPSSGNSLYTNSTQSRKEPKVVGRVTPCAPPYIFKSEISNLKCTDVPQRILKGFRHPAQGCSAASENYLG